MTSACAALQLLLLLNHFRKYISSYLLLARGSLDMQFRVRDFSFFFNQGPKNVNVNVKTGSKWQKNKTQVHENPLINR